MQPATTAGHIRFMDMAFPFALIKVDSIAAGKKNNRFMILAWG